MSSGELDPGFVRSFRSTWEDTPSSHAVPHSMLTALGLTRGDYLDVKAWIFLVARKLQFENGERAAFKNNEANHEDFLAEPILAALKPRLLDDINDPRLALRAYLVVMHVTQHPSHTMSQFEYCKSGHLWTHQRFLDEQN
ncbi:hypothetical protein, conserved [Eimeria maxima]|uniref:Uncharacterized protein n=1 Tax=Eimeria maxima TaxID=5804 RepID=U6MH66_EIMMA|nr:hypothetical protein, conserved [Eimeria maxima]CDJ60990.1 hypothetical protein, conserved [Eimeria maxima]